MSLFTCVTKTLFWVLFGRNKPIKDRVIAGTMLLMGTAVTVLMPLAVIFLMLGLLSSATGKEESREPLQVTIHIEEVVRVETRGGNLINGIGFSPRYISDFPTGCPTLGEGVSMRDMGSCFGEESTKVQFRYGQEYIVFCPQVVRWLGFWLPFLTETRVYSKKPCRLIQK